MMPWPDYAKLPPEDLEAIYSYLRSRPVIANKVDIRPGQIPIKE